MTKRFRLRYKILVKQPAVNHKTSGKRAVVQIFKTNVNDTRAMPLQSSVNQMSKHDSCKNLKESKF